MIGGSNPGSSNFLGVLYSNISFCILKCDSLTCVSLIRFIFELCDVNARFRAKRSISGGGDRSEDKSSKLRKDSVRLAVHFLLNSYFHVKKRQRTVMNDVIDNVESIVSEDKEACKWLAQYLAQVAEQGSEERHQLQIDVDYQIYHLV